MKAELPDIAKLAERLLCDIEQAVKAFPRYHKYSLGSELREQAMLVTRLCHRAWRDRSKQAQWVSDPRLGWGAERAAYHGGGHYGVVGWEQSCGAVSSAANLDNGRWSVADPRLPAADERLVCVIRSLDNTWHRPFTTLELAALQSLIDPEEFLELDGKSDSEWREQIGNAVPPAAAEAIAGVMGTTILLAMSGETFLLSSQPIWVRPEAVALSVRGAA